MDFEHKEINFNADYIGTIPLDEWLKEASEQYFPDMPEDKRIAELTTVHEGCTKVLQDAKEEEERKAAEEAKKLQAAAAPKTKAKSNPPAAPKP